MAEDSIAGGRLLGTAKVQEGIDEVGKQLKALAEQIKGLAALTKTSVVGGSVASGAVPMSYGHENGGGGSFAGAKFPAAGAPSPFTAGLATGNPTSAFPKVEQAPPGTPIGGGASWGGKAAGYAMSGAATTFSTLANYGNRVMPDQVGFNYISQYASRGAAVDGSLTKSLFSNQFYGQSTEDRQQGIMSYVSQSGNAIGTQQATRDLRQIGGMSVANPTMPYADQMKAQMSLTSTQGYYGLAQWGVSTLGANGRTVGAYGIGNQLSKTMGLGNAPWNKAQINATFNDQNSAVNSNFRMLVGTGAMTQEAADAQMAQMRAKAVASSNGVSGSAFNSALKAYQGNAAGTAEHETAQATLKAAGITDTALSDLQEQAGTQQNRTVNQTDAFAAGVEKATDAVGKMSQAITNFLERTGLDKTLGYGSGASAVVSGAAGGTLGALGSIASSFGGAAAAKALMSKLGVASKAAPAVADAAAPLTTAARAGSLLSGAGRFLGPAGIAIGGVQMAQDYGEKSVVEKALSPFLGGSMMGVGSKQIGQGWDNIQKVGGWLGLGGGGQKGGKGTDPGNDKAQGHAGVSFIPPRPLTELSSSADYGPRSTSIGGGSGFHTGIDLVGSNGAPIKASAGGTVVAAGWGGRPDRDGGYGNCVTIDHGGGYQTLYCHMSSISVSKGDTVRQGQNIGGVGDTGSYSSGAHLHFELWVNGSHTDPLPYLNGKRAPIKPSDGSKSGKDGNESGTGQAIGVGMSAVIGASGEAAAVAAALAGGAGATGAMGSSTGSGSTSGGGGGANPSAKALNSNKLLSTLSKAGFSGTALRTAWAVAMAESGGSPTAHAQDSDDNSYGLFQINMLGALGPDRREQYGLKSNNELFDPNLNAKIAFGMSQKGTNWSPWGAYTSGAYKDYYNKVPGYAKGAWEIDGDQSATVHDGEMIIPKDQAETIRSVLMRENVGGLNGNRGGAAGGLYMIFQPGSIKFGSAGSGSDAKRFAKQFVDAVADDHRVKELQKGH